jgi:hypothetical protein
MITIASRADFEAAIAGYLSWRAQFCDERGNLRPKYEPTPMVATFMRPDPTPGAADRETIPVPQGPVEVW